MKVWVAVFEHQYGSDLSAFKTFEGAERWRQQIAEEWWEKEFPGTPKPDEPKACADEYFDRIDREYFNCKECVVQP